MRPRSEEIMNEFVSSKSVCLMNSHAECTRVWISQADGLLPAYFQTEEPQVKSGKGQVAFWRTISKRVHSIVCQHCARNKFGMTTPRAAV
jgi:hypothetical protein